MENDDIRKKIGFGDTAHVYIYNFAFVAVVSVVDTIYLFGGVDSSARFKSGFKICCEPAAICNVE